MRLYAFMASYYIVVNFQSFTQGITLERLPGWFGLGTTVVETYGDVQENPRTCKISLSIKMVYLRG